MVVTYVIFELALDVSKFHGIYFSNQDHKKQKCHANIDKITGRSRIMV